MNAVIFSIKRSNLDESQPHFSYFESIRLFSKKNFFGKLANYFVVTAHAYNFSIGWIGSKELCKLQRLEQIIKVKKITIFASKFSINLSHTPSAVWGGTSSTAVIILRFFSIAFTADKSCSWGDIKFRLFCIMGIASNIKIIRCWYSNFLSHQVFLLTNRFDDQSVRL